LGAQLRLAFGEQLRHAGGAFDEARVDDGSEEVGSLAQAEQARGFDELVAAAVQTCCALEVREVVDVDDCC